MDSELVENEQILALTIPIDTIEIINIAGNRMSSGSKSRPHLLSKKKRINFCFTLYDFRRHWMYENLYAQ